MAQSEDKQLSLSKASIGQKPVIQNSIIKQTKLLNYLGIDIVHYNDPARELRSQINKARCLRDVRETNKYMRKDRKFRVYKSCIR